MQHGYDKDALKKRLHRIEGQVRGIERMVDDEGTSVTWGAHVSDEEYGAAPPIG